MLAEDSETPLGRQASTAFGRSAATARPFDRVVENEIIAPKAAAWSPIP
jgi:hypothetical protein